MICESLLIDFIWFMRWSCLRCQVVMCRLRCLRCKLLSPCILISLGVHALWAFALYYEGSCPVSFRSLCWGLMPCECIYALMMRAYALDDTTCMIKKLKLHSRVKFIRCCPWVAKMLSCFSIMSCWWSVLWWIIYECICLLKWWVDDVFLVNCNWWIICLTLMFVTSHPFCLEMLLFIWVTCRWSRIVVVDCFHEWISLTVSLDALILNGMGTFVAIFYSFHIAYDFTWLWFSFWTITRCFDEGFVPRLFILLKTKFAAKFWIFMLTILWRINCYLFHLWFLRNVTFRLRWENSDFIMKFLCWENGVLHFWPIFMCFWTMFMLLNYFYVIIYDLRLQNFSLRFSHLFLFVFILYFLLMTKGGSRCIVFKGSEPH